MQTRSEATNKLTIEKLISLSANPHRMILVINCVRRTQLITLAAQIVFCALRR